MILVSLIRLYQKHLSPLFNHGRPNCIYPITCSEYAIHQLQTQPLWKALPKSIWRILSCNPINAHYRTKLKIGN